MLAQRWSELKLQFATSGRLHPQTQTQQRDVVQSAPSLRISPLQVSSNRQGLNARWWVRGESLSTPDFWGVGIDERVLKDCYMNESRSTPDYSSRESVGYHSNDTDSSDQEKGSALSPWPNPVQMDLRPEPFDSDADALGGEAAEAQQVYAEVLPRPLRWLHLTLGVLSSGEAEDRAVPGLPAQDPSLPALVSRLIELERLQAATVLRERVRTGRPRPATAVPVTRCCSSRQRKPDPADPRSEFSGRGDYRSAVSVCMDVAPADTSMTHKTRTNVQTKQRRSKMAPKHPAVPSNRPSSCSDQRAQKPTSGLSPGSSTSLKPTSLNKTKRLKATKKEISKKGHTGVTKRHKNKV